MPNKRKSAPKTTVNPKRRALLLKAAGVGQILLGSFVAVDAIRHLDDPLVRSRVHAYPTSRQQGGVVGGIGFVVLGALTYRAGHKWDRG